MPNRAPWIKVDAMPSAAAVLQIDDDGRVGGETTERLGAALYGRFLEEGPYAEVRVVLAHEASGTTGEQLAEAIRELAAVHDVVDVVLSIHTTHRDPQAWRDAIPPEARKLRLVYSTACEGDGAERAAWEAVEARVVVTHPGVNNPLTAAPLFLSRWIDGAPVGEAVREAFAEEARVARFCLSLPSTPSRKELAARNWDFLGGSRPVVTGDASLRIDSGLSDCAPVCPEPLRYARERAGPVGLILRALAGRFVLTGEALRKLVAGFAEKNALPFPRERLERIHSARVVWSEDGAAELLVERAHETTDHLPNAHGVILILGHELRARPGVADPVARKLTLDLHGIQVGWGAFSARITHLDLHPEEEGEGYALKGSAQVLNLLPLWRTFHIGGTRPEPPPSEGPVFRAAVRAQD